MENHTNKHIILQVYDLDKFCATEHWVIVNKIAEKIERVSIELMTSFNLSDNAKTIIANLQIPFMLHAIATNFEQLDYLCSLGVSAVYIGEDLGFNLDTVAKICHSKGIQVRVFANVAQSSVKEFSSLKKFFIRPEDIGVYEDVIDVIEFWGELNRQYIMFRIYKSGKWQGTLSEIISELDISINSSRIVPTFAQIRKNCGRKCLQGYPCRACETMLSIGDKLKSKQLIISKSKQN